MNIIEQLIDAFRSSPSFVFYKGVLSSVGVEDHDACMRWAFGDCYSTMLISDSPEAWNDRHSDIFLLSGTDDRVDSLRKIGRAYLEYKK